MASSCAQVKLTSWLAVKSAGASGLSSVFGMRCGVVYTKTVSTLSKSPSAVQQASNEHEVLTQYNQGMSSLSAACHRVIHGQLLASNLSSRFLVLGVQVDGGSNSITMLGSTNEHSRNQQLTVVALMCCC